MTEQQVRAFLAQFKGAREEFDSWPQWMRDAARKAAATFPKMPTAGVNVPVEGQPK